MRHLVSRPHIIFSVQNPKFPGKKNVAHEVAIKALQKLGGGQVHPLQGFYDSPETSILISNPSDKQAGFARYLVHATGQESHIESDGHSHKMYFSNGPQAGKIIHGTGTTFFDTPPENYFSTLPDGSTFSHHFNFDESEQSKTPESSTSTSKFKKTSDSEDLDFESIDPWDQAKHDREQKKTENFDKAIEEDVIEKASKKDKISQSIESRIKKLSKDSEKIHIEDLLGHYKLTAHSPGSLALKYIVHRIENENKYKTASPSKARALDKDFIKKNKPRINIFSNHSDHTGWITPNHLTKFYSDNIHLKSEMKDHQQKLHDLIRRTSPELIRRTLMGEEHVALTRGLNTASPKEEHTISSYADANHTNFGTHQHHRWVPLKNIWYSYDAGPRHVLGDYGTENEFLVSPHKIKTAQSEDVEYLIPKSSHSYSIPHDTILAFRALKGKSLSKLELTNALPQINSVYRNNKNYDKPSAFFKANKKNLTSAHIKYITSKDNHFTHGFIDEAVKHPNFDSSNIDRVLEHDNLSNEALKTIFSRFNNSINEDHLLTLARTRKINNSVVNHPLFGKKHLDAFFSQGLDYAHTGFDDHEIYNHPSISDNHIKTGLKRDHLFGAIPHLSNLNHLSLALNHAIKHSKNLYLNDILNNPNSTQVHVSKILETPNLGDDVYLNALLHADAQPNHIKQFIKKQGAVSGASSQVIDFAQKKLKNMPKSKEFLNSVGKIKSVDLGKNDEIKIPKKAFISEHKKLLNVLEHPTKEKLLEEAKEQSKELKEKLKKGVKGDWQKEGYTLSHELSDPRASGSYNPKKHDFKVIAHDTSGKKVGFVYFSHHPDGVMAVNAEVHPAHRQKGLGRAMAELAVKASGKKIKKSPDMTPVAQQVWGALSSKTKAKEASGMGKTLEKAVKAKKAPVESVESGTPLTVKGKPTNPNPAIQHSTKSIFDENEGILHTPKGSFKVNIPSLKDQDYQKILNSSDIQDLHQNAMKNWFKLNHLVRSGYQLPDELVAHANIFSILSANTPVPSQELAYSRLVDTIKQKGLDPRTEEFSQAFSPGGEGLKAWKESDSPILLPEHSREYWTGQARPAITQKQPSKMTGRQPGDIVKLATIDAFSKKLSKYPQAHAYLSNLVSRYGGSTQQVVSHMMADKANERLPKNHPMRLGFGLGSKTGRYAVSMMGSGESVIPDTHFVRHMFGLDSKTDKETANHLKEILWNEKNHHLLNQLDSFYHKKHPAVRFVTNKYYDGVEDPHTNFPAFWLHWLSIAPHEKAQGIGKPESAKNLTDHTPFFDTANEILDRHGLGGIVKKSEENYGSIVHRSAKAMNEMTHKLGNAFSSMVYYAHILPQIVHSSNSSKIEKSQLQKTRPMPSFRAYGEKGRQEQNIIPVGTIRQAKMAAKIVDQMGRRTKTSLAARRDPQIFSHMKRMADPNTGLGGANLIAGIPGRGSENKSFAQPGNLWAAAHEGFHASLANIKEKHGEDQYNKILDVMEAHLHPDDRAALHLKLLASGYQESSPNFKEEILAHTHSHLSTKESRIALEGALAPGGVIDRSILRYKTSDYLPEVRFADRLSKLKEQASRYNQDRLSRSWNQAVKWANAQKPPVTTTQESAKLAASEKSDLFDLSKASKNVREQRERIFGTKAQPDRWSDARAKAMNQIRRYAEKKYGLPLVTASGKRDESGQIKEKYKQLKYTPFDVFTEEGRRADEEVHAQIKEENNRREPLAIAAIDKENETRKMSGKPLLQPDSDKKHHKDQIKSFLESIDLDPITHVDPKPDWRSGQLETQPSPDAAVHELAHLDLAPEGMTVGDFQSEMDRLWGESQVKHGHMKQKRTQGEIQPMSVENPLRRELGLPANRTTKPVKTNEIALDDPNQKRFVEAFNPATGKKMFFDRQSRLQNPDTKERRTQISEGSLKFDPKKGWHRALDTDALINLRSRGLQEEATKRLKQRTKIKTR